MNDAQILSQAFESATKASGPRGHARAQDELQRMFSDVPVEHLAQLYARATELADACYDVSDACRAGRLTEPEALASLAARFPGFSAETYRQALSWGAFLTR